MGDDGFLGLIGRRAPTLKPAARPIVLVTELAFDLVEAPHVTRLAPFRFAHHRVRGAYQPWARVQSLDAVAEALERADVDRAGPAFGVYYDLPRTEHEDPDAWTADLGFPVPEKAHLPTRPGLRVRDVHAIEVARLRYRGDLASFPNALQALVSWVEDEGLDAEGCLLERFHVSDALTGEEERDVMIAIEPITV